MSGPTSSASGTTVFYFFIAKAATRQRERAAIRKWWVRDLRISDGYKRPGRTSKPSSRLQGRKDIGGKRGSSAFEIPAEHGATLKRLSLPSWRTRMRHGKSIWLYRCYLRTNSIRLLPRQRHTSFS